jgi:DNA-binding transcriptional regulator YiaG
MSKKQTGTNNPIEEVRQELIASMRARARLPKHPGTRAASLRKELKLTQGKAAELLNISKNTWIRWEKGQCKPDELALEMLTYFVKDFPPIPCSFMESLDPFDRLVGADHIQYCKQCRLVVKYMVIKGKL